MAAERQLWAKDDFFVRCLAADSLDLKVGHLLIDKPSNAAISIKPGRVSRPAVGGC